MGVARVPALFCRVLAENEAGMLRFEKMTVKAQEAVQSAQEVAARHENQQIEPVHLLAALVSQADGVVPPLLARLGVRSEALSQEIEREVGRLPKVEGFGQQHMGRSLNDVLERAFKEADSFKDEYVSTEHLFLAIAGQERDPAGQLLKKKGASHEAILQALTGVRGTQRVTSQNPEATYESLEKYARDLTELARKSKLDPVIGRDEEIRRVMQILARRTKNNPVLIGEPGAGRAARHWRNNAQRIQEIHRERSRAGAQVPARPGQRADGRRHHRDSTRIEGAL